MMSNEQKLPGEKGIPDEKFPGKDQEKDLEGPVEGDDLDVIDAEKIGENMEEVERGR
ncbi:hypothetical protein [Halopseudomonas laoshanensis]|uniref:hypothetical protein n=1 Tax=Halopseudomonas laoshanensis TaxID=2268758 RepID=UPI0015B451CF|nr:hypothetical protein [Halopseudomonas laoshanensis]